MSVIFTSPTDRDNPAYIAVFAPVNILVPETSHKDMYDNEEA